MISFRLIVLVIAVQCTILYNMVGGHGRLLKPPGRSTRWRYDRSAPRNYNDDQLYCGGLQVQIRNGGKCGLCGDNYNNPTPRANELGGKYGGSGVIVATYESAQSANIEIDLTKNHKGYFQFDVCNLDESDETEDCFAKHPLQFNDSNSKFDVTNYFNKFNSTVILPSGLNCEHCVLRWTYTAGNNWGTCSNGRGALGCGPQETFRGCADIRIKSNTGKPKVFKNRGRAMKKW